MKITTTELEKHTKSDDLWVAVDGKVIDVTKFQDRHPGGSSILRRVAGKDATKKFLKFHPTSVLRLLDDGEELGTLQKEKKAAVAKNNAIARNNVDEDDDEDDEESEEDKAAILAEKNKPGLGEIYNLFDFEAVARRTLRRVGWYYYSSGSDDEITLRENHRAFQRIWFRPRVLVNVSKVEYDTTMLGIKTNSPFYITATALSKLGHPDGETVFTKAAAKKGVIQMVSTLSSCSIDEVMGAAAPGQPVWMQVYVNANRDVTRKFIQHCESIGVKGFFVTVDAPQLGRREKDMRSKYDEDLAGVQGEDGGEEVERGQGASRAISAFIDPSLSWDDIPFLRASTTKPLVIKGVQRWEDAVKAAEVGLDGIILSNHGGRQLEFSRGPIEVLSEVMPELRKRGLDKKIEVFIDGGIRRGTDVLKALCLGAKGVGIGRPFIYAMSTYGVPGVVKAIQLMNEEIEMNLRLLGVTKLSELSPDLVDIKNLDVHDSTPIDHSSDGVYERLLQPQFKHKI